MTNTEYQHISFLTQGDLLIIRLHVEKLNTDELIYAVKHELIRLTEELDIQKVILDLGDIEYITSSGLGGLAAFYKGFVKSKGGTVVLCNLQPNVQEVLSVCRFVTSSGSYPMADLNRSNVAVTTNNKPRVLFENVTPDLKSALHLLAQWNVK